MLDYRCDLLQQATGTNSLVKDSRDEDVREDAHHQETVSQDKTPLDSPLAAGVEEALPTAHRDEGSEASMDSNEGQVRAD